MGNVLLVIAALVAAGWLTLSLIIGIAEIATTRAASRDGRPRGWELHLPHPHLFHSK